MVKTGTLHLDNFDLEENHLDGLFLAPDGREGTFLDDYPFREEKTPDDCHIKKRDVDNYRPH